MKRIQVFAILTAMAATNVLAAEPAAAQKAAALPEPAAEHAAAAAADQESVSVMDVPMNGSDVEAFNKSLKRVEEEADPADYNMLSKALQWHLFYDLSAAQDKAKLYRNLDGKTPKQIIESARR